MTAGRPLLLIPYAGQFEKSARTCLSDGPRPGKSARAVHDAIPFLLPDAKVTVLCVESAKPDPDAGILPTAAIADHLARHGLAVTAARTLTTTDYRRPMHCWTTRPTSVRIFWWLVVMGTRGRGK